jgi:hypothetical protein
MMEEVLRETRANKHPAQILGLSRHGLFKMLKRLDRVEPADQF